MQQIVKELFGKEPHKGVNPDEVVAVGAAIQAGVLAGEVKDLLLLDVTPLSLGIETLGGVMTTLIPRNTTIPDAQERDVLDRGRQPDERRGARAAGRAADGARQPHARQGSTCSGLPPAPRGVPQIEVTFDIDANGIVNVSAKDMATQKEQKITITASSGLSKDEVDRMMREAESHADEDKKRKEEIETRNQADQAAYAAERMLKDSGDKLRPRIGRPIESAIEDLKSAIEKNDASAMKKRMDALNQAQHKAAEAMYRAAGAAGGAGGRRRRPARRGAVRRRRSVAGRCDRRRSRRRREEVST